MNKVKKTATKSFLGLFLVFSIFLFTGLFELPSKVFAAGSSSKQFAGKIQQTTTPPITCSSQYGVMFVQPKGGSKSPGPFIIESTSKNVSVSGQILGKYEQEMDMKTCYIDMGYYRIQVPVYKIKNKVFNTSKR